jgi:hypothetical protein
MKNLLLSPRNSLDGQLSLMKRTDCKAILAPKGYRLQQGLIDKSGLPLIQVAEIVELLAEGEVREYKFSKGYDEAQDDPLVVVHTSGSTGLPKPIVLSHGWVAAFDRQQYLGPWNGYAPIYTAFMGKQIFCSIPPFHVCNPPPQMKLDTDNAYINAGFWSNNLSKYATFVCFRNSHCVATDRPTGQHSNCRRNPGF